MEEGEYYLTVDSLKQSGDLDVIKNSLGMFLVFQEEVLYKVLPLCPLLFCNMPRKVWM